MRIFRQLFKGAGDKRDAFEQEEMALDARIMLAQGKKEQAINLDFGKGASTPLEK